MTDMETEPKKRGRQKRTVEKDRREREQKLREAGKSQAYIDSWNRGWQAGGKK